MSVTELDGKLFDDEISKSEKPVLVDFWAPWCGPCRSLAPVVAELSDERSDVRFCKVNVDEAQPLAIRYGIDAIPALLLFKGGSLEDKAVGFLSKGELNAFLDKNL